MQELFSGISWSINSIYKANFILDTYENVVGAGPAGLYTAIRTKQKDPSADITIFEKGPKENNSGLGYLLQEATYKALRVVDADQNVVIDEDCSLNQVALEAKNVLKVRTFNPSDGIPRPRLLKYLRELAHDREVSIRYDSELITKDLEQLKQEADLLIGADGMHSIVRQAYRTKFGAHETSGTNSYTWLAAKRDQVIFRLVIAEYQGAALIAHCYPTDKQRQTVIIEGPTQTVERLADEHKRLSTKGLQVLEDVFSTRFSQLEFQGSEATWRPHCLTSAESLAFENVVLVGDAAFNAHYSSGVGILKAFHTTRVLSDLAVEMPAEQATYFYSLNVIGELMRFFRYHLAQMHQLEKLSDKIKTLDGEALINEFASIDPH